jgi:geranylgeranyl diphosphate synthase type II
MIGGASHTDSDFMYEFGKNLGIAFQIRDDLLDIYGNTEKFGKKIGTDIIANKKTYLILKALEEADDESGKILRKLISTKNIDPEEKITTITGILNRLGIREIVEVESKEYYNKALRAFDLVTVNSKQKKSLKDFVKQLMEREK